MRKKGGFGTGNNIYLYSLVDVQMTYLLLVFVTKYVYIRTPTPDRMSFKVPLSFSKATS